MGQFTIEITATGGHGVDRNVKDGEVVNFFKEGNQTPDAMAKFLELQLTNIGYNVENAVIKHWPDTSNEVIDNLKNGIRKGNF